MDCYADHVTCLRHWRRLMVVRTVGLIALLPALAFAQPPSTAEAAKPQEEQPKAPTVSVGENGFVIQSATGGYRLQIGALLQVDGRFDVDDEDREVVDTFAIRRARPYLRGRVGERFEFYVNPDFGLGMVVLQDAYIDTLFSPSFVVRLGKTKTPFGFEKLIPASNTLFFERGFPTALVPNRDVGVQVFGDLPGGIVSYAASVVNGAIDGASSDLDTNDGKDLAGRIVIRPFGVPSVLSKRPLTGLTVAVAGTTGNHDGPLPTIRTVSLLQSFLTYAGAAADGRLNRYSPAASYYFRRVGALAEYVHMRVPMRRGQVREDIAHRAWQLAGAIMLTKGDTASDRGVRPQHNFDFGNGHIGALQIAARYHVLSADHEAITLGLAAPGSSREARAWTLGLNWYLNPNFRYVINFERTLFDDEDETALHPESAIVFRAQVNF
jgi:phosphate-selective porin OprO/OprP